MRQVLRIVVGVAALVASVSGLGSVAVEAPPGAVFEGRTIDLTDGWGAAQACLVWPEKLPSVECFASEEEMDQRIAQLTTDGLGSRLACSEPLRLYDGTSFGLPSLALGGTSGWENLAAYGFDNRTSSYSVGSCNSVFAAGSFGGGSQYPTSRTTAYSSYSSMLTGWNNRVSSVRYP